MSGGWHVWKQMSYTHTHRHAQAYHHYLYHYQYHNHYHQHHNITATLSLKEKWDIFFMGDLWSCEAIPHSSQPQKTTSSWWTLNEVHLRSTTHTVLDLTGINFKSSKNVLFFHFKDSNHNIIIFCTCLWWLDVWYLDFEIKIPCRLISNFLQKHSFRSHLDKNLKY